MFVYVFVCAVVCSPCPFGMCECFVSSVFICVFVCVSFPMEICLCFGICDVLVFVRVCGGVFPMRFGMRELSSVFMLCVCLCLCVVPD